MELEGGDLVSAEDLARMDDDSISFDILFIGDRVCRRSSVPDRYCELHGKLHLKLGASMGVSPALRLTWQTERASP
ncbi:hypothetical protein [Modestobacter sp. VKM Ac-2978]|uniref:hypothetical protein n=1 Tax=Modestobacter sp. VKM Ac-2978 TaxID=3004132 RepID=UPI0022AA0835|nr:hypothetical protein [Modestobacter sp. VKM Ac-2978]MCZ2850836.1 hypothetical protein [Modestobacter sp. VKM Ac-2978]